MSITTKLATARRNVHGVAKTRTADTGSYQYKYAALGDVLAAVDDACNTAGIQWVQHIRPIEPDRWQLVTTIIDIDSPDEVTLEFGGPVNPVKGDPQAQGSALTYARRYALVTLFGMNVDDDDGAQASRAAVAEQTGGGRTEAETKIREMIRRMPSPEMRTDFKRDFKARYGPLSELPESRHGEAWHWAEQWGWDVEAGESSDG